MDRYFPWSRMGRSCSFFFFKCSLKSKGEAYGERNSKNCLENSEKSITSITGRSCSVDKIIDNSSALLITDDNSARWGEVFSILSLGNYK